MEEEVAELIARAIASGIPLTDFQRGLLEHFELIAGAVDGNAPSFGGAEEGEEATVTSRAVRDA